MDNLNVLHEAILKGDLNKAVEITQEAIAEDIDPQQIINNYMSPAM